MKKKKVTYGVYGLVEWHASIKFGKSVLKATFTGGTTTTGGTTPATLTTTDPVVQMAIEQSAEFKSGKIRVVRSHQLNEELVVERNGNRRNDMGQAEAETDVEDVDEAISATDIPTMPDAIKEVTVACIDDAMEYLRENYGIAKSKMRSKVAVEQLAEQNGIKFVFSV